MSQDMNDSEGHQLPEKPLDKEHGTDKSSPSQKLTRTCIKNDASIADIYTISGDSTSCGTTQMYPFRMMFSPLIVHKFMYFCIANV